MSFKDAQEASSEVASDSFTLQQVIALRKDLNNVILIFKSAERSNVAFTTPIIMAPDRKLLTIVIDIGYVCYEPHLYFELTLVVRMQRNQVPPSLPTHTMERAGWMIYILLNVSKHFLRTHSTHPYKGNQVL